MSGAKRRNEHSQLRKEEYEDALESSESQQGGHFARASAAEMATRRIVRASDRFVPKSPSTTALATPSSFGGGLPFGGSSTPRNPFAGVILKPTETRPAAAAPLATPPPPPSSNGTHKSSSSSSKMSRCNAAFARWVERQSLRARSVAWTEGVLDYIRYAEAILKEEEEEEAQGPSAAAPPPLSVVEEAAEGEAMPVEAPAELIRADDGEERDAFEAKAAIKRLDTGGGSASWRDLGKGMLRVMEHRTTSARRIVVRNGAGKVILNFKLVDSMKFLQDAKGNLRFTAVVDNGPQNLLLKTKPPLTNKVLLPATLVPHA